VVGMKGETLDRHDRGLCMMYPCLVLLKQFLRQDGTISYPLTAMRRQRSGCCWMRISGNETSLSQSFGRKTTRQMHLHDIFQNHMIMWSYMRLMLTNGCAPLFGAKGVRSFCRRPLSVCDGQGQALGLNRDASQVKLKDYAQKNRGGPVKIGEAQARQKIQEARAFTMERHFKDHISMKNSQ